MATRTAEHGLEMDENRSVSRSDRPIPDGFRWFGFRRSDLGFARLQALHKGTCLRLQASRREDAERQGIALHVHADA